MPIALPDEVLARFRESIKALTKREGRIGLAVSGGGDSLALLSLAQAAMPDRVDVATVNHGLRAEAADEATFVASICATFGLSHSILAPAQPISGSLQTNARKARYEALGAWADERDLAWIATAHHADDQAETVLMRLLRGSGLAGLSAIRATNGRIIRPLLNWRRSELQSIVTAAGLTPVDDPSNHDPRFDRVKMRAALLQNDWINPTALARSAACLADANDAIDWSVQQASDQRLSRDAAGISLDPRHLPTEIVRRLIVIALERLNPKFNPRGAQLSNLIETLQRGEKTEISGIICRGGGLWHFSLAPPRLTK